MQGNWKRNRFSMPLIAVMLAIGGLVIHLAGLFMIRVPLPDVSVMPASEPFVIFLSGREGAIDPVLAEQSALRDPASLFLPTRWNHAADINQVASLQDETELFSPYSASLTIGELEFLTFRPSEHIPVLAERVGVEKRIDIRGFGRTDRIFWAASGVPANTVHTTEVKGLAENLKTGRRIEVRLLLGSENLLPDSLAEPASTNLHIAHGRLLGSPHIDETSGFAQWDARLLQQIQRNQIEPPLADGYWRIKWYLHGE